ncbi:hypothetical protein [Aeromicrobium sp.]|uniref:hypothetical protein n=1 Tax=Aeromicrobium sp. TaxID=1871063 RepID=UPI0030C35ED5
MADDIDDDQDKPDQSLRDRRQAQSAAGDLSRMGIDPRSLGLGEPVAPSRPTSEPDEEPDGPQARVLPLRPEYQSAPAPRPFTETAPPPEAEEPPSAAEQMLGRPGAPAPAPRQASRLLRTVARGMVTPDAAVTVQGERQSIDAVRQRQTDRRIIAFIAGKGGVGCTTVAVGVGTAFMAMREDRSVVVDVQQGTPSLGETFGASAPRSVSSLLAETEASTPPTADSGLGMVDGSGWDQGLGRGDVAGVLDRLRADHTFNLLDVGDDAGEAGHAALARADQAVIVTGPGELGIAALRAAVERLRLANPRAAAQAVHVVVCQHEQSHRDAQRELSQGALAGATVVVVPPDPYLQSGHAYDPAQVAPATREALLRVAGAVAVRGVRP